MFPELLKLDKAQQQNSRLACKPCWDLDNYAFSLVAWGVLSFTEGSCTRCPAFSSPCTSLVSCREECWFWVREFRVPTAKWGSARQLSCRPPWPWVLGSPSAAGLVLWWRGPKLKHTGPVGGELRWASLGLASTWIYMISKKLVDTVLFLGMSAVKDSIFCMLKASNNSWMKQIFSWRSLAFGKLCFACLEFPCVYTGYIIRHPLS